MKTLGTIAAQAITGAVMACIVAWCLAMASLPILGAVALLRYVSQ